jgi:thiol:disulfide interchange protein DsbD
MRRPAPALASTLALGAAALVLLLPTLASAAPAAAGGGDDFAAYQARGWVWMYLGSFGAGFLTSLTPCVYPLIPITLGIFGARGKDVSRKRSIALAAAYVVGMGLTYAILGVIVASVGGSFGTQLANPFVVIPLVLLFVALAMSMFGAFELNLPPSLQARLNQVGGQGFGGAFAMGLVGGFIAAPCTGPFLAGLLAFVASTGSVLGGGSLLFVYALGMGVLFFAIAAFAMALPKSGRWMEWVKSGGGLLLLVGAIYFLRPLLPWMRTFASPEKWFLFAALGVVAVGLLLGAIHLSFHGDRLEKARKGAGVAMVLGGIFCAWSWFLTPKHHLPWIRGDEEAAFAQARREGKGVLVDFSATWCTPCEEMELTFGDDDVYAVLTANFVPLKFDVSEGSDADLERRGRYGAKTLPAVVFVTPDRDVLARVRKLVEPDELLRLLKPATAGLHPRAAVTP